MNDLHYIFYEPKVMFLDTVDMSSGCERSHRRLADYIWFGGKPPRNRPAVLCKITKTEAADWPPIAAELAEKGWLASGDFLIHRGIIKSLNESKLRYMESFNRQCKMNKVQPLIASAPDDVTGIVEVTRAKAVKRAVAPSVTPPAPTVPPVNGKSAGDALLTPDGAARMAGTIVRNTTDWSYDNCKVTPQMFVARTLAGVLKPYEGRVTEKAVLTTWHEAANATHQAAVDGLVKTTIAGYLINCWRTNLDAEAAAK